jgi:hypothetical protein
VIVLNTIFGKQYPEILHEAYYVRQGRKNPYHVFYIPAMNMEFPFLEEEVVESSSLLDELI